MQINNFFPRSKQLTLATSILLASCLHTATIFAVQLEPGDIVVTGFESTLPDGNGSNPAMFLIDPTTGNRTIISDNTHGTGPAFTADYGVTIDSQGDLLVADAGANTSGNGTIRVDPVTGNRTVVSSTTGLKLAVDGNRILASGGTRLASIDLLTGIATVVSGNGVGTGPALSDLAGILTSGQNAIVADFSTSTILNIDLSTGDRSIVSGAGVGGGHTLLNPNELRFEKGGNLLVASAFGVLSVNPLTGDRTLLSGSGVGTGPQFTSPFLTGLGIAADGTVLVLQSDTNGTDPTNNVVFAIDPLTGNRTILSDPTHGTGPDFFLPGGMLVVPTVPEPSTIVLAALAALLVILVRRGAAHS